MTAAPHSGLPASDVQTYSIAYGVIGGICSAVFLWLADAAWKAVFDVGPGTRMWSHGALCGTRTP